MVELMVLDYLVNVLERVEYILAAMSFLKIELVESPRLEFRQQLQELGLLEAVEIMPINWEMRNRFLSQRCGLISNEALLWCFGWRTAHDQARQWWIDFLTSLTQ